ncbi:hypothetical protein NESM_000671200 [Novymonas esmeraldas]|uniref:Uncharacterized protein n=1 Tax=Novymonas esmeraldas TaxID=1808958 RepID=A0AAW0EUH6_9TRYP
MSSSSPLVRPSKSALRGALQTVLAASGPPVLLPRPPAKSVAWRTRRIVEELKALSNVEALAAYETELRGLVHTQEMRCRTKLVNHAYEEECALREVELVVSAEAAGRRDLTDEFYAIALAPFEVVHLRMEEEMTRRSLRSSERAARRLLRLAANGSRLALAETDDRAALGALEACSREELTGRRLLELGNALQREIVVQSRLSGHLRCVGHSRVVERARRHVDWQEATDRAAVERLYALHTMLLLQDAAVDFTAAVQRDVVLLSGASHASAARAHVADCEDRTCMCEEQERQLRLTVEEQEHASFKATTQAFLLGWRAVYKQVTKDPDVTSVFAKIELLVRRDIADQQRNDFGALSLSSHAHMAVLTQHRAERRALCQRYIDGARAVSAEESRRANELFRAEHLWQREQAALRATTLVTMEEKVAGRGLRGAEAQARLLLKLKYLIAQVQLHASAARQGVEAEEQGGYDALRREYVRVFFTDGAARLVCREHAARAALERAESAAAVDTFLPMRQALMHSRVSDASRPLARVEDDFRARVEVEESRERRSLARQGLVLAEAADRISLAAAERAFWRHLAVAKLCAEEDGARRCLWTAAHAGMAAVRRCVMEEWEREGRLDLRKSELLVREGLTYAASPLADAAAVSWHLTEATDVWGELEAGWGDAVSDTAAWGADWPLHDPSSLTYASALRCEDVLVEAYLERDSIHFLEHREWLQLLQHSGMMVPFVGGTPLGPPCWLLHSLSMRLEPQQRAASINVWHSNQSFDIALPLRQEPDEAIIGEHTVSFYAPDAGTLTPLMPRDSGAGMVFFLILDEEGTVLASATVVVETTTPPSSAHLCVALDNGRGYIRLV